jgi:hypothetical protein
MSSPPVSVASSSAALIEAILRIRFPEIATYEAVSRLLKSLGANAPALPNAASIQAERERLQRLPDTELWQLHKAVVAQDRKDAATEQEVTRKNAGAKTAAKEQKKFYNRPEAEADLDHWTKVDWTIHESVVVLLGKEPRVVTWPALKQELEARSFFGLNKSPLPPFLCEYRRLRELALCSNVMTSTERIRPTDVIQWADRVGVEVPAQLRQALAATEQRATSPGGTQAAAQEAPLCAGQPTPLGPGSSPGTLIKRKALVQRYRGKWPTVERDLQHGSKNGLSEAARGDKHGHWREEAAVHWAKQEGKFASRAADLPISLDQLPRRTHKLDD